MKFPKCVTKFAEDNSLNVTIIQYKDPNWKTIHIGYDFYDDNNNIQIEAENVQRKDCKWKIEDVAGGAIYYVNDIRHINEALKDFKPRKTNLILDTDGRRNKQ